MQPPKKSVHFSVEQDTILYTYSEVEYSRSRICVQQQFTIARQVRDQPPPCSEPQLPSKKHIAPQQATRKVAPKRPFIRPLDFSSIPNGCRRMPAFMDDVESKQRERYTRPKLSIDTKPLPQQEPLFLAQQCSTQYNICHEENSSSPLSYLSPSTTTCI
ncbi:hypothetical protein BCR43DRAFT_487173 [Syncephalastrum racemosum]|uniref:Uncharacterized protein n=1 Tax=Syncephalastrum racemosum TaxID=13706 RepID=A0A1X2HQE7_SYNRA|nr:hypothetical protein BCR43DRAFT_487173 [Syncephalastrum racemosum]